MCCYKRRERERENKKMNITNLCFLKEEQNSLHSKDGKTLFDEGAVCRIL